MKTLRPYQAAAIKSLFAWLYTPNCGNPLIDAPVGAGKSLLIAETIRELHTYFPRLRILVLAHVKELLEQNAAELRSQYPTADFDFYCEGLGRKRLHNDITFASIQSVHSKIAAFNRCPQIILIDECHLINPDDNTLYRKLFDSILQINPDAIFVGFTGTCFRADSGRLDEGEGAFFDGVAYKIGIDWMIENGYLVRPVLPTVETHFDIAGVKTSKGDYIQTQLQKAVDVDETTKACIDEVLKYAGNRKRWFGMTAGVLHCEHTRDELRSRGIACEMIHAKIEDSERKRIIEWFKESPIDGEPPRALVNVGTLNVGFNCVHIDLLFPMRPTRSPVLYIQYTGRGLRPVYAPGFDLDTKEGRLAAIAASAKPDVLFLDFGDIVKELGPIDAVHIPSTPKPKSESEEPGEAIFKVCPACGTECAPAQKFCFVCSYNFAAASINKTSEKNAAILAADEPIRIYDVLGMTVKKHYKGGLTQEQADALETKLIPTMCVSYMTIGGEFREYIGFEHPPGSYPRDKAKSWHRKICKDPSTPIPSTIDEALQGVFANYNIPHTVSVRKEGDFDSVKSIGFEERPKEQDGGNLNNLTKAPVLAVSAPKPAPATPQYEPANYKDWLDDDIPF